MTGIELLLKLTERDYTYSKEDQYAQTLMTIWSHIGEDIFPLLEQAKTEGKKLEIKSIDPELDFMQDFLTLDDIILV